MAKLFSIVLFMSVLLALLGLLSGCGGTGSANLASPFGNVSTNQTGKNRNDAWAEVETKKGEVVKELEETEQKKLDLEIAKAKQVTVNLDSPEKINAWNNAQATRDLGEVAKNLSKGNAPGPYAAYFQPTPVPKSAFAEGVEAIGGVAVRVVESPTALAGTTGYMMGKFMKGAGSGDSVSATEGSTVTINKATATGKSRATAGNTTGGASKEEGKSTEVDPVHWSDCNSVSTGAASLEEINSCMQDYGYATTIQDGKLYLDGIPYTGTAVQ